MGDVVVLILHREASQRAGPLERWLTAARARLAELHRAAFARAGADRVLHVAGPPDDTPFGARVRALVHRERPEGVVVLGSGAIPLARAADRRELLAVAASGEQRALANNLYSADVVAIGCADRLRDLPDLPADNALPRWLAEVAGYVVGDVRRRWRLAIDLDTPLDLVLVPGWSSTRPADVDLDPVQRRLASVAAVAHDRRAELVVSGRTSAATLGWLERSVPARVRAFVEERGLRAASRLAQSRGPERAPARAPSSALGLLLDRDGPETFAAHLARLGDAAIVDTRVLLAHRHGGDERRWPSAEDRFASDLLLVERIGDPWLRELTRSAAEAPIPILLGGHTLVGPGVRLVVRR